MRRIGSLGLFVALFLSAAVRAEDKPKLDPAKLVGKWTVISSETDGKKSPADDLKKIGVELSKEAFTLTNMDSKFIMKYKLDPSKTPCTISIEITEGPIGQGAKAEGIIALDGDQLKLCYPYMGGPAPKEFATKEGSGLRYVVMKKS